MSFLNVLSKRAAIWIFSKVQFFLNTNIKLCFEVETISRAYNARFGKFGTLSMF